MCVPTLTALARGDPQKRPEQSPVAAALAQCVQEGERHGATQPRSVWASVQGRLS